MRKSVFHCDCMNPDGFMVTVDRSRSRDEMIAAGDYRNRPQGLRFAGRFTIEGSNSGQIRLGLIHLYTFARLSRVLLELNKECDRRDVTLADAADLLALGEQHRGLQLRSKIVELGTIHPGFENRDFPSALALTGYDDGEKFVYRDLEEIYLENGLKAGTHIAIVLR